MKVFPIGINVLNPNLFLSNDTAKISHYANNSLIIDTYTPSFTSVEAPIKIDLSPALNTSGVHCPGCGIKMLSQNDYEMIVERASKIQNTEEFVELLNEYKRYIPNNMRQILSGTDNDDYKNLSMAEYYNAHRYEAMLKKRTRIYDARKYLKEYAKNLSEEDRKYLLDVEKTLNTKDSYKIYKEKVTNLADYLNLDWKQKNELSNNVLRPVASSYGYYGIFHVDGVVDYKEEFNNLDAGTIAKSLVENIFKNSVSNLVYLDKHPAYLDNPNNSIVVCKSCGENNKNKLMFWKSVSNPFLVDNIKIYLGDIAKLIGQGKIKDENDYIKYVCNISSMFSAGKINFDYGDIDRLYNVRNAASRHEEFLPIEQSKVDIPCACCGSIMLPHSVRLIIQEEMKKCETPVDYAEIIKKYDKYLGKYSKAPADIFIDLAERYPDISHEDFLKKYKRKMNRYARVGTNFAVERFYKNRKYYLQYGNTDQLKKMDMVAEKIINYIKNGNFNDYEYSNLYKNCVDINDIGADGSKALHTFLNDLKEVSYRHSISRVLEHDLKDKDGLYTIVFKMFLSDVATATHLIAPSNGGGASKDNLIGLCKACSSIVKSRKNVNSWYTQNLGVRVNLPRQLKIINYMAMDGDIDGYEGWAEGIAQQMYGLTNGKFDIRDEFS